jgi:CheY-like chemotaxis protein
MQGKKILFVEDDVLMSRMYKRVFTAKGYVVEIAEDGQVGYEKAKTFRPDLIFLDVMMPKMNGIEMLDLFKADPLLQDIPIIMLTNLDNIEEIEIAKKKGVVGYLVKSDNDPEDVVAAARNFFGE